MFKWLTTGFIFSLALILAFALTDHLQAPHPIYGSLFNACTNLAYGFAASYIFYLINIYLPEKENKQLKGGQLAVALINLQKSYEPFLHYTFEDLHYNPSGFKFLFEIYYQVGKVNYEMLLTTSDDQTVSCIFIKYLYKTQTILPPQDETFSSLFDTQTACRELVENVEKTIANLKKVAPLSDLARETCLKLDEKSPAA